MNLQIYGYPTNRTICVSGDLDLTHWATISDDQEGRDVVAFSDGTVIEFHFEADRCQLRVLAHGSATLTTIPGVDEVALEGDIRWALVAFATEFARVEQPVAMAVVTR